MLGNLKIVIAVIVAAVCKAVGMALVFVTSFNKSWTHKALCGEELDKIDLLKETNENLTATVMIEQNKTQICQKERLEEKAKLEKYRNCWMCRDYCQKPHKLKLARAEWHPLSRKAIIFSSPD
jgi:hypothetical protein